MTDVLSPLTASTVRSCAGWRGKGDIRFKSVGKHEWVAGSREVSSSKAGTNVN